MENEYTDVIFEAIRKNELKLLLRGDENYNFEPSQYAPGAEPTDTGKVLSKVVYKAYKIDLSVKEKIEQALYEMLGQMDYDVYIVILYIVDELFNEKNNLSPFKMNMSLILKKMSMEIRSRENSIKKGIEYPNGFMKKSAWDEIERFRCVCKEEYGVVLY